MKSFPYSVTGGCLPCCGDNCRGERPMAVGDTVILKLNTQVIALPDSIEAKVISVATIGNITTYVFEYDESFLTGTGVTSLAQCFVDGFPTCKTKIDDFLIRLEAVEAGNSVDLEALEDRVTTLENDDCCELLEVRMLAVESSNSVQDGQISTLQTLQAALQASQAIQDGQISSLQATNVTQNGRISTLEASQLVQDDAIFNSIVELKSTSGQTRYYKPTADTVVARTAALVAALADSSLADVVVLKAGHFEMATALSAIAPTTVRLDINHGATLSYVNPDDGVPDLEMMLQPRDVSNLAEFEAIVDGTLLSQKGIQINITGPINLVTGTYVIPHSLNVSFGPNGYFNQVGNAKLRVYGEILAERKMVFKNFLIGQIRGPFGNSAVLPEWWGMTEREGSDPTHNPTNILLLDDDRPINCAAHSTELFYPQTSVRTSAKISLAMGTYFISRPLDFTNSSVIFEGVGPLKTDILTTTTATADSFQFKRRPIQADGVAGAEVSAFFDCEYWPQVPGGNHGFLIMIGGDYNFGTQNTFRCQIRNITINAWYVSTNNWTRHISCVSAIHGVEEQTVVEGLAASGASGFNLGFARHHVDVTQLRGSRGGNDFVYPSTVNGLTLHNFDFGLTLKKDSVPIHTGGWATQFKISKGTINCSVAKSLTYMHASPASLGVNAEPSLGIPNPNIYPDPRSVNQISMGGIDSYITYPDFGIVAQGNVSIENVHFEGMVNAVYVKMKDGTANRVTYANLDAYALMDRSRGAVWVFDGCSANDLSTTPYVNNGAVRSNMIPFGPNDWKGFSTIILISNEGSANFRDSVCGTMAATNGGSLFLIRDEAYGIHYRSYGQQQLPDGYYGDMPFFWRSDTFIRTRDNRPSSPGGAYSNSPYTIGNYTLAAQDPASDIIPPTSNPGNFSRKFFELGR